MSITTSASIFDQLAAEFPRDQVSWRAQNVTKDGDKAMALAYIDARDVMDRLDAAVGPENWQDRYEVHGEKTICYISIAIDGPPDEHGVISKSWVTKADGSGDSQVEEEKGAISGAFKRAAVKFGVGRYLYTIPTLWVPCESSNKDGKNYWRKWTANPWDFVKVAAKPPKSPAGGVEVQLATSAAQVHWTAIASALSLCETVAQLNGEYERHKPVVGLLPEHFQDELKTHYFAIRDSIAEKTAPTKSAKPSFDKLAPNDVDLPHKTRIAMQP